MGLDITAYSRLEYIGKHPGSDDPDHGYDSKTYKTRHVEAFAYDAFPHALAGIDPANLSAETSSLGDRFIAAGCFAVTESTQTHEFQAGSYPGYGHWREDLANCFDFRKNPDDPFYELIWFADNEGTLCTQAAAELLKDFEAGRDRWTEYWSAKDGPLDTYQMAKYEDWVLACSLAADSGLIDFH